MKENFPLSSLSKQKVTLYADSFDESGIKSNLVQGFFDLLGNKLYDKVIICCRTEYLEYDDTKWFKPKVGRVTKKYIAPIDYSKIELREYVVRYCKLQIERSKEL